MNHLNHWKRKPYVHENGRNLFWLNVHMHIKISIHDDKWILQMVFIQQQRYWYLLPKNVKVEPFESRNVIRIINTTCNVCRLHWLITDGIAAFYIRTLTTKNMEINDSMHWAVCIVKNYLKLMKNMNRNCMVITRIDLEEIITHFERCKDVATMVITVPMP